MAVKLIIYGQETLLFNIYAPTDRKERESFYAHLAALPIQHEGMALVGGDFNCCLGSKSPIARSPHGV